MDNLDYLFAAFAVLWAATFGYVFFMTRKQKQLRQEIERLEQRMGRNEGGQE